MKIRDNIKIACGLLSLTAMTWTAPLSSGDTESTTLPSVMSLDYCTDQYVLVLADRSQIMAVSPDAGADFSFYRDRATGLPSIRGSIAEVLAGGPDIALQSYSHAVHLPEMAARTGVKLIQTQYGNDADTIVRNFRKIGEALGQHERAEAQIEDFTQRLARIQARDFSGIKVGYLTPGGFTTGKGTFVNDLIRMAGFGSWAEDKGYSGWLPIPMEDMVMDPPDMFVTSFFDTNMKTQSKWSLARHDKLDAMMAEIPTVHLPGSVMACNGLFLIEAVEQIRRDAERMGVIPGERTGR